MAHLKERKIKAASVGDEFMNKGEIAQVKLMNMKRAL